ncbi:hypothetical protein BU24DRAFT_416902 [Aaosphaeria arxii CBS 175.79]|uniref:Secreted protein n=1 Tax=Aaosphaeria arxii CBS 175.79 TaxID=1450172 RepID=A0A6A5Y6R0_9PLEO|nr:uncharacterized protein BU24DRAFT_416902 [Aaosphaeria arxii CBS 175.79]KAF2021245.1 hypothetical protein BU24DRAFT_416902 [Aaosphaeria arxii CBS 175.79]
MQFTTFLAVMAPIIATVQAGCYSGGDSWGGDQGVANSVVDQICNGGGVSGSFQGGQTKYACRQLSGSKKGEFWVRWTGAGTLSLNDGDCRLRLKNEINGCSNGGESTVAGWFFRSDPNGGAC